MTRYRSERYTDQEEMETSNEEIQTREIHRPGTNVDATKSATSDTRAKATHRTSTEQSRQHQRGSTRGDGATRHAAQ